MRALLEYSGMATKIRAMRSNLLSKADYLRLIECDNIIDVVNELVNVGTYKNVFQNENIETLRRNRIEQLVRASIYVDYNKIYNFSNSRQREYLKKYFVKYEITILKMCLRLCYGKEMEYVIPEIFENVIKKKSDINIPELINSKSVDEFVNNLRGTVYYNILRVLKNKSDATLYDYEILLDIYYFKTMWQAGFNSFSKRDRRIIIKKYGTEIDMLNLQWIYRAKKYFKLSEAQTYALVIPVYYRLTKQNIRDLVCAADDVEYIRMVKKTVYGSAVKENADGELEKIYDTLIGKLQNGLYKKFPYSVACIDSYFYFKETEVKTLIMIIEGIRYGKSKEQMKMCITGM